MSDWSPVYRHVAPVTVTPRDLHWLDAFTAECADMDLVQGVLVVCMDDGTKRACPLVHGLDTDCDLVQEALWDIADAEEGMALGPWAPSLEDVVVASEEGARHLLSVLRSIPLPGVPECPVHYTGEPWRWADVPDAVPDAG